VGHDNQSNNVKLLLVDTVLEEQTFLIQSQEFLLEFILNVDDVTSDVLKGEFPSFSLLFFEFLLLDKELLEARSLIFGHLLVGLGHPVFTDELLVQQVLFFLESELTVHHHFKTTLTDGITLQLGFSLESLPLFLLETSALLLSQVLLHLDLIVSNIEDELGVLEWVLLGVEYIGLLL
jgi:hypothetical protein